MSGSLAAGHVPVSFNDVWWQADLHGATTPAKRHAENARQRLSEHGIRLAQPPLRRCDAEARDGTDLAGCVKLYVPDPVDASASPWGLVLTFARYPDDSIFLRVLAFGLRHPPHDSRRQSVYQTAHRRLHG